MTRPQTVQDVFEALSQHRLVESARLDAFMDRHHSADIPTALERLVAEGLLTPFQANEVASGHGARLWLGSYRVIDRLGRGGMGNVFLAEHAVLGRRVAVKSLSDSLRADPGARKRFVREARAAAALDHPNIVRVFDVNMLHEPPYLVMEYVDGLSLQAAVAQAGTFSAAEAAAVGVQVADGLVQAAAVGLVHRDIKPANVLIDRRGAVKILDLGIVRFTQDETHSRLNATEVILGTIDYLAPEQAEDSSKVDIRADIYALGATLYFLLAGHPPYPVADVRRKLNAKRNEDPPLIHELRPDVPPDFSTLLGRLMARDPAERIPAPAMVVAALHAWASPGADFPSRLFRMSSDTTAHGRRLTDHEPGHDPLPDTILIIKAAARRGGVEAPDSNSAGSAPPSPPRDSTNALGNVGVAFPPLDTLLLPVGENDVSTPMSDTQGGAGAAALTDEILALPNLPDTDRFTPISIPPENGRGGTGEATPGNVPTACGTSGTPSSRSRFVVWLIAMLIGLGMMAGLVVVLAR